MWDVWIPQSFSQDTLCQSWLSTQEGTAELCLPGRGSVSGLTIVPRSVFGTHQGVTELINGSSEFPPKQHTRSPTPSLAGMTQNSQNVNVLASEVANF